MSHQAAVEEYAQALRKGQKEYRELLMEGKNPHPVVLDEILPDNATDSVQDVGLMELPAERIIGVKSAGRITAFTASFRPLLEPRSEFGTKWMNLCAAHLSETGITDPIQCFEYLGNFYVQEGNKRVSVLRHFGAPRIPGYVKRILPPQSEEPRIKAYYEFLEFFKGARLYTVQFRRPGDYAKLLSHLGKEMGEPWTEEERRTFNAGFHYLQDAFQSLHHGEDLLPEEALLLWLDIYPFKSLSNLSAAQLKKVLGSLWDDVVAANKEDSVKMQTKPEEEATRNSLLKRILSTGMDHMDVAFVHQLTPETSTWVMGHEEGREHIQRVFKGQITVRSYYDANTPEEAEAAIQHAVADGAQVVFTTSPPLSRATLKAAVEHPKVHFLNCSVDQPYSSLRTYYARVYEGKFITGAIAGAMASNDRIGFITSYPIFGVPASINAFALGAQLTNPRAQVELRWSCLPGTPQKDFFADNIRVISNRSVPVQNQPYLDFCSYGTYLLDDRGELNPLGAPVWLWGKFYEYVLQSLFSGNWKNDRSDSIALNYWLGMDSGVIDVKLSKRLPEGVRQMAMILRKGIIDGSIDPFCRRIVSQDGTVRNDGTKVFTPEQILHMDWLCDNVVGYIPKFEELLPASQPLVRELGIYRDQIPPEREGAIIENTDHI